MSGDECHAVEGQQEAKPLGRNWPFHTTAVFLVTVQSGVKSMAFSLDDTRDRLLGRAHAAVECVTAPSKYKDIHGSMITLRDPLRPLPVTHTIPVFGLHAKLPATVLVFAQN